MTAITATAMSEPREPRCRGTPGRGNAAALVQGLDRLRDALLHRLDQIETLAAEQAARLDQSSSEREQALRERAVALEAAQTRLQAELRRREQEWHDALQQLEDDRRLLTEAWERLEQERVEGAPSPQAESPREAVSRAEHAPPATHRQPDPGSGDDSVTREILRQFQALRGDVRRAANGPGRGGT